MNKYLLYRISSKVNAKPRIAGFSKLTCLDNLLAAFPGYRMVCLADNCDAETVAWLRQKNFFRLEETRLGQAASFYHLVNGAIETLHDEDIVYFIEDDYLHLPEAGRILEEGLQVFDYVTLYDHPDKYGVFGKGRNPYVDEGKLSEATRVFKGALTLWRTTNSTTHTFACHVKTLKEDRLVWLGRLKRRPKLQDFYDWIFLTRPGFHGGRLKLKLLVRQAMAHLAGLAGFRKRTLGVPIPSASAHLEANFLPDHFDIQRFQTSPSS
ncbi:MAG: hypothetical protein KGJ83_04320 [Betaproteobacteria bacterium]|nr:hypothetical protein [Betaproteobacteria bacterium]